MATEDRFKESHIGHFSAWYFLRMVLERGAAIGKDDANGKFGTYEEYARHIDHVSREFHDALKPHLK